MHQWIPRGTKVNNRAVRKLIVSDSQWQLYDTRTGSYVLAVNKELIKLWRAYYADIDNIFTQYEGDESIMLHTASDTYLISSLGQGPYPESQYEIEAFAVAYSDASKDRNLEDALYIEEHSMLLPTHFDKNDYDNELAFGKWITGGVEVSAQNTNAIEKLTTWIPYQALYKTLELADINVEKKVPKTASEKEAKDTVENNGIPNDRFTLVGRRDLETFINDHIVDVLRKPDEYKRMGIDFPGATILYGPPGSGKTFAIEKLADFLGWPRYDINSESIGSPYIHETGKKIAQVFDDAIHNAPAVIIIDEMESFLSARDGKDQHHVEEVAEFLRKIPEAIENHVLVFAMTNLIDSVDPAIRRRGRFDYVIEVGMASKEEIKSLLEAKMQDLPIDEGVDIDIISSSLEGHPLSDVTFILKEAGRTAVKSGRKTIDMDCINIALSMLPKVKNKKVRAIGFSIE